MQIIAQGWLVYQISGSELALGLVGFASAIPVLIISPWAGVVVDHLKMSSRLLIQGLGRDGFWALLNDYWHTHPPEPFVATECRGLARWLLLDPPEVPHLRSLLDYDLALIGIGEDDGSRLVRFDCEPLGLLTALGHGQVPGRLEPGDCELELTADGIP